MGERVGERLFLNRYPKSDPKRVQIMGRPEDFEAAGLTPLEGQEWEPYKGGERTSLRGDLDDEEIQDQIALADEYNESIKPKEPESAKEWMMDLGLEQASWFFEVIDTWRRKKFTVRDIRVQMGVTQREAKMVWRLMANDGWVSQDERLSPEGIKEANETLNMMEILEAKPKKKRKRK